MSRTETLPLGRLFAMALNTLLEPLHERLARAGFDDARPAYAFVLLALKPAPLTSQEIAALLGITKQAASKLVAAMEDAGYILRRNDPNDARAKRLDVAPRGRRCLQAAEHIYAELEADWARILGKGRVAALRGDLLKVLKSTHTNALPPLKPVW